MEEDKRFKVPNPEAIRKLRMERGWSQEMLAQKATYLSRGHASHVSLDSIKRVENKARSGARQLRVFEAIARALGVSTKEIFLENAAEAERQSRSYTWEDIEEGAQEIKRKLFVNGNLQFDAVLTFPAASSIFCGYFMRRLPLMVSMRIPVYTAMFADASTGTSEREKHNWRVPCSLFDLLIPRELLEGGRKRIVVIDDCILTGRVMDKLKDFFAEHGPRHQVQFACCICHDSRHLHKWLTPDIIGLDVKEQRLQFEMPWGDAYCFEDAFPRGPKPR